MDLYCDSSSTISLIYGTLVSKTAAMTVVNTNTRGETGGLILDQV